jgi:hypothetical protein
MVNKDDKRLACQLIGIGWMWTYLEKKEKLCVKPSSDHFERILNKSIDLDLNF